MPVSLSSMSRHFLDVAINSSSFYALSCGISRVIWVAVARCRTPALASYYVCVSLPDVCSCSAPRITSVNVARGGISIACRDLHIHFGVGQIQ